MRKTHATPPADLTVDTDELRRLGSDLRFIASDFHRARDAVDEFAGAFGHPALAGTMHRFTTSWKHHRARIVADVGRLADAAEAAGAAYDGVDAALAGALAPPP